MTASLLPLPNDPRFATMIAAWEDGSWQQQSGFYASTWLGAFERLLQQLIPTATNRDRKLTARHYFPGYLRDGHDVP